ncbi:MAG: hypothetical protein FJ102_17060 [Deltaproteobacteria bacterium]|nr:hypothetical protein [Deltaproteobacteria bacterium]
MTPSEPEPVDAPAQEEGASEEEEILKEEVRLGASPRGTAANGVLLALSRAARSFLLYEPTNEAIRVFLENLRRATDSFLGEYGDLDLVVRPFELLHAGEVVYLERDRERSLAFRLYRDGVRRLVLRPGLTWHELLKLLEVVSIRYVGVRQTEDDMVVLLWKAGFQNLSFDAVEGFVADSEDDEDQGVAAPVEGRAIAIEAPPDFDLPMPTRPNMTRVQWREVPQPAIHELLAEDTTQAVPELAVRLCEELLAAMADPNSPLKFLDIVAQLNETRDFLFAEGLLAHSVRLAYATASANVSDADSDRACAEFLQSFVSPTALARFLHSVSRDAQEAPPELQALLESMPGDHLRTLVHVLDDEHGEASRRVTRRLIEGYVATRGDEIVALAATAPAALCCELLRVLRYADLARAATLVPRLLDRNELELQLEILHTLQAVPTGPEVLRVLLRLAGAENEEVRLRAIAQIGERNAAPAFQPLAARLRRDAALRMSHAEAAAIGEALAHCDGNAALGLFRDFCKPRGLLSAVLPGQTTLQWAAVAGLVLLPSDEVEPLVKHVHERAGSELQAHCTQAMVRRRRAMRAAGPR